MPIMGLGCFRAAIRMVQEFTLSIKFQTDPLPTATASLQRQKGRELYFHRNRVLEPGFDQLKVGTEVRFDEEMGEQGPQATKSKQSIATLSHCER